MLKKVKRLIVLVATALLFSMLFPVASFAKGSTVNVPVTPNDIREIANLRQEVLLEPTIGQPAETSYYSEASLTADTGISLMSTKTFRKGMVTIEKIANNKFQVTGSTEASRMVDTIAVTLHLQIWDGSKWVDIVNAGDFHEFNRSYVFGGVNITVPTGYTYRARAHHFIQNGVNIETASSHTGYFKM